MNSISKETRLTIVFMLIAFAFSVAVRMIWTYQFAGYEPFMFNGQFMINTNDGYYWAEGARDILNGVTQATDRSPIDSAASQLTVLFAYILPFSFESIIFFMPAFLSSLIVVPIILIAKLVDNLELGFIAALIASITWSYYNRTMIGYYDSDMLNIVFPMFILWSIIWSIKTDEDKYLLSTVFFIFAYNWWYLASHSLEVAFIAVTLAYILIFDRKNIYNYKLLALMLLAMMQTDVIIKLILVLGVFFIFKQEKFQKYVYYILGIAFLLFIITGGLDTIFVRLKLYIFKDVLSGVQDGLNLHFFSVMQTVRESGQIPFETFANRISGHVITFILSVIGFAYLAYRHKIMLLALPLVGLGFLASVGGLRFTVYAVPIMAFGIAFLITELSHKMPNKKLIYSSMAVLTIAVLYPNIKHIESYKVPTVFNSSEVSILDKLKDSADREDYVISWWDYGYPIRYYSDVKTLADGGKHSGSTNFPVSFILTNPQDVAAKMARLDVEYTEKRSEFSKENKEHMKSGEIKVFSNIEQMTKDYGFNDTNDFLLSLQTQMKLPEKTRDIYLYLPFKMLNIYPTIKVFSNIDLMSGTKMKAPFFFSSKRFADSADKIDLGNGVSINKRDNTLNIGNQKVPIKRFVKTFYDKSMRYSKSVQNLNITSSLSVIYMSAYNMFLVVDESTYNSLYVQLMILEEYDKTLFEMVDANPYAKVFKLKI